MTWWFGLLPAFGCFRSSFSLPNRLGYWVGAYTYRRTLNWMFSASMYELLTLFPLTPLHFSLTNESYTMYMPLHSTIPICFAPWTPQIPNSMWPQWVMFVGLVLPFYPHSYPYYNYKVYYPLINRRILQVTLRTPGVIKHSNWKSPIEFVDLAS